MPEVISATPRRDSRGSGLLIWYCHPGLSAPEAASRVRPGAYSPNISTVDAALQHQTTDENTRRRALRGLSRCGRTASE